MMRRLVMPAVLVPLAALCGTQARAQDAAFNKVVPTDHATIQEALDSLPKDGHVTVRLLAGDYDESVVIDGFSYLTVQGDAGARIVSHGDAPAIRVTGSELVFLRDFAISSEGEGLHATGTGALRVSGVTVESAAWDGIVCEPGDVPRAVGVRSVEIKSSTVRNAAGNGIVVRGIEIARVEFVTVEDSAGSGVVLDAMGRSARLRDVTVTRPGADGIVLSGTDAQVIRPMLDDAVVEDAAGAGVRVQGTEEWELDGVVVTRPGTVGIVTDPGARIRTLRRCAVTASPGDGLRVSAERLTEITVDDCAGHGVLVTNCESLSSSHVSRTGGDGIRFEGVPPSGRGGVFFNEVQAALGSCIHLAGAQRMNLMRNIVARGGISGYRLGAGAAKNRLKQNQAFDCRPGLAVDPAAGKNRVRGHNRFGLRTK
jgi:hypothetical protein